MVRFLGAFAYTLAFYGGSVPIVIAAMVAAFLGERPLIAMTRRWSAWHRWCARIFLGIRHRIVGDLPPGPVLFVFKHESMYETIDTLLLFHRPVVVMKRQLMDIPVWGLVARRFGSIPVDRKAGAAAMRQMIAAAKSARDAGRPVILFPEGTRVPHGEQPPLRAGFAGLYKVLDYPVVPIAVDSGRLWRPRTFLKHPGTITYLAGEAIPPGLPREKVEARVHQAINALNGAA